MPAAGDVAAREAALVEWAPVRECGGKCHRCEAFRNGWDDAMRGTLPINGDDDRYDYNHASGYNAARDYAARVANKGEAS
jgi:hypothetical protein